MSITRRRRCNDIPKINVMPRSDPVSLPDYLPGSMDDIIRTNRNHCRLALATEAELERLSGPLQRGRAACHLTRWQILAIHLSGNGKVVNTYHLVGRVRGTREPWVTSKIQAVDLERRRVRTENSLYGLWGRPGNECDVDLRHLCATLNYWGIGQHFGVPAFYL